MENQELINQISTVAKLRSILDSNKSILDELKADFELAHKEDIELVDYSKRMVEEAETKLRELTIKAYNETGNKQPADGVGIRVTTDLEYEEDKALQWGIEHHGMGLKLDKTLFEKIYKATPAIIDFVTPHEKITATISKEIESRYPTKEE